MINNYLGSKSFHLESSIMGELEDINDHNQANKDKIRFVVPLKQLSKNNLWRSLKIPLISSEIELIFTWSKNCIILINARRYAIVATELNPANISNVKPVVNALATSATFELIDTKLDVSVITLSKENDKKLLEQLKSRFKRTVR